MWDTRKDIGNVPASDRTEPGKEGTEQRCLCRKTNRKHQPDNKKHEETT